MLRKQCSILVTLVLAMSIACTATNLPEEEIEAAKALLLADVTFEATAGHLQNEGRVILWSEATIHGEVTSGPLSVVLPVMDRSQSVAELHFDRGRDGTIHVSLSESSGSIAKDESVSDVTNPAPCQLGELDLRASCPLAVRNGTCVNGQPHYERRWYDLDYYYNGRVRASTYDYVEYNCGTISSSPYCSSVCYGDPTGPE
jgi:hypothetical protein